MRKDLVEWWVEYDPGNRGIQAIRPRNTRTNSIHEVRKCPHSYRPAQAVRHSS